MARNSRPSKSRASRPSKMGRKWTQNDVLAYNMKVVHKDLATFFGVANLPSPNVGVGALTAQDAADAQDEASLMLIHADLVTDPDPDVRESATIGFVEALFNVLQYRSLVPRTKILMFKSKLRHIASQGRPPQLDACIMDDSHAISLVVKVDRRSRGFDPEARLISDAIGAFHNNNLMRIKRGTNPLPSMVMPGIVMDGTMPTFYQIPVIAQLVKAIEAGEQPKQETIIHAYRPEVPRPEEGIKPLDNRYIILSCFEAFRRLVF